MTDYVIEQSINNKDVKTCGMEDLSFTSEKNLFKIYKRGRWNVSLTENPARIYTGDITIPHNLGYFPGFTVYGEIVGFELMDGFGYGSGVYYKYGAGYAPGGYFFEAHITDNNLFIDIITIDVPGKTITVNGIYAIYLDEFVKFSFF